MEWKQSGRKTPLSKALNVTLKSKPGRNVFCLMVFLNQPIRSKELTGADTCLCKNCTVKWHFTSLHRVYVHKYRFTGAGLYVLSQLFWLILFLTVMEGYHHYLFLFTDKRHAQKAKKRPLERDTDFNNKNRKYFLSGPNVFWNNKHWKRYFGE